MKASFGEKIFFKRIGVLAGGSAFAQLIAIAGSPIISRIYSPKDFGVSSVFGFFFGVISVVSCLRYEIAISLPEDDEDAANLAVLSFLSVCLTTLITAICCNFLGDRLLDLFGAENIKGIVWMLPVGIFAAGIYQVLNFYCNRKREFHKLAFTKLHQSIASLIVQVVAGLALAGPIGLIGGQIAGNAAGLFRLARGNFSYIKNSFAFSKMVCLAKKYNRFPLISVWSSLINSIGLLLPTVVFSSYYGLTIAGSFALCKRVLELPTSVVSGAVMQVFISDAPSMIRNNFGEFKANVKTIILKLFMFGLVPTTIFMLWGTHIFIFCFGKAWATAGFFSRVVALPVLMQFAVSPVAQVFNVLGRQDLHLLWNCIRFLLLIICFAFSWYYLSDGAIFGIVSFSVANFLSYLILLVMIMSLINRESSGGLE